MGLSVHLYIDTGAGNHATVEVRDVTYNNGPLFREALKIESLRDFDGREAGSIVDTVADGITDIMKRHSHYRTMLAPMMEQSGGWGGVNDSLDFLGQLLNACRDHPKMKVSVS